MSKKETGSNLVRAKKRMKYFLHPDNAEQTKVETVLKMTV